MSSALTAMGTLLGILQPIVKATSVPLVLLLTSGCASRVVQRPPDASVLHDLEESSRSRAIRIEGNQSSWEASSLRVRADSLYFADETTAQPRSIALQDVERLSIQNRNRGAATGALWGLLLGVMVGGPVVTAAQSGGDYNSTGGAATVALALTGGLLGAIWGGYHWGWTHYEIHGPDDPGEGTTAINGGQSPFRSRAVRRTEP